MSKLLTIGKPVDLHGVFVVLADLERDLNREFGRVAYVKNQIGGTNLAPDIRGIRETSGPTLLTIGTISDGDFLKRVGTTIVGAAGGGGGGAPTGSSYVVVALDGTLTAERTLGAASPLALTDTGANGSISVGFSTQLANLVLAGPPSGGAATPGFRSLVIADIQTPADTRYSLLGHTHTFASLTAKPTTLLGYGITDAAPLAPSYITIALDATLTNERSLGVASPLLLTDGGAGASASIGFSTQANNVVLAGPTAGGPLAPTFRLLVAGDIPNLDAAKITTGVLTLARGATGVDNSAGIGANAFFGGPSGGAGAASFRALVAADIPNLDTAKITTGVLPEARGGTNQGTYATGDMLYASAANTLAKRAIGGNGFSLMAVGGLPVWSCPITRLTADNAAIAAAVPTTVLAVANLQQAALINEEYYIEWVLHLANSVAADVFVFNVLASAGTLTGRYTVEGTNGVPNLGAGVVKLWSMPVGTLTTANANAPGATGTIGLVVTVTIKAWVKLTVAGGNIQVGVRAGTNAAASSGTATVKTQSAMTSLRLA